MKKVFTKLSALFFCALMTAAWSLQAQNPTYNCVAKNDTLVSAHVYQFDIFIERTGATDLYLNNYQLTFAFDNALLSGGNIAVSYVSGSTQLGSFGPSSAIPNTLHLGQRLFRINGPNPSTSGIFIPSSGLKIGTFRITNNPLSPIPFAQAQLGLTPFTGGPYYTYVYAVTGGVINGNIMESDSDLGIYTTIVDITTFNTHTTDFTEPILNKPLTLFDVTGSGPYCPGGSGRTIGLSGSEPGVYYHLYKDGLPVGNYVAGTGSALSWGDQTVGTYTVFAYRAATYIQGNMNGTAVVTLEPLPVCGGAVLQNTDPGQCYATVTLTQPVTSVACGPYTVSNNAPPLNQFPTGTTVVTWTLTDNSGYTSTCTQTVTVQDAEAPVPDCSNSGITVNTDAGVCKADVFFPAVTATDNCGVAGITYSHDPGTTFLLGATTVTATATDIHSNSASCTFAITVVDNEAPHAFCTNITIQLDHSGNASIVAADVNNNSWDACGIASLAVAPDAFTCNEVGANTVVLTVTDNNGNVSTCAATVTVLDNIAPDAYCKDITIQLDHSGNASIVAADVDNNSWDACGIASLAIAPDAFTCNEVGANTVVLTVTDNNTNVSTCAATVTVLDIVSPDAYCKDITIQLDHSGNASIVTADVNNNSWDACGIASLAVVPDAFTCNEVGANTVVLTVTDNNTNVSTCAATVTVLDIVAPDAYCKDITIQLDHSGNASIVAADVNNNSWDACGIASLAVAPDAFTCNEVGANTVVLTVTDNNGNVSTCAATVTVQDNVAPDAYCKDITIQLDHSGNASIVAADVNNNSWDACGIASLAVTPDAFTCNEVGANTVVLTVTDNNTNVSTCAATVTVLDIVAPDAYCKDITIQLDHSGNASIVAADVNNNSWDACGIASLAVAPDAFTCNEVGANTVVLTVTDNNGNVSTCAATVTVQDNVAPDAYCKDITIQLDHSGNASIVAADVNNNSWDACGIASLAVTPDAFTCNEVGANTVVLTVTDNNGNVSTCAATVTVQDNVAPDAYCKDITIQLDHSGNASIVAADVNNNSWDACGIASLVVAPDAFTCNEVGANTVVLTVTDNNGNVSTCAATVTVQDNVAPDAYCKDITIQLGNSGNASIVAADVNNNSWDACGIASLAVAPDAFTCNEAGANTVVLTVTDNNGNVSTCAATVTVLDNIFPTIACQGFQLKVTDPGQCTYMAVGNEFDPAATWDNCSFTLTNNHNNSASLAGALFDKGSTTVTWTITDASNNQATCAFTVIVKDEEAPQITCPADETRNTNWDLCTYTTMHGEFDPGALDYWDNCPGAYITNDKTLNSSLAGYVFPKGTTLVTWTVTDAAFITTTCTFEITVADAQEPQISCVPDQIRPTTGSFCAHIAVGTEFDPTYTWDNCPGATYQNDYNGQPTLAGAHFDKGTETVTWTITDATGNIMFCSFDVEVYDNEAPTISCMGDIQVNTDGGLCSYTHSGTAWDATFDDNCPGASMQSSYGGYTTFDGAVFNKGAVLVTWTATDASGLQATCSYTVTVVDNQFPTISCPGNQLRYTDDGVCSYTTQGAEFNPVSVWDNCLNETIQNTYDAMANLDGAIFPKGTHPVTWTVTDASGNNQTASCSFTVTIEDNEPPFIDCPADVTLTTNTGVCYYEVLGSELDPLYSDNCTSAAISINYYGTILATLDGVQLPKGTHTLTWSIDDDITSGGNVEFCIFTVTVIDSELPTITCPGNQVRPTDPLICEYVVQGNEFQPLYNDNCPGSGILNDHNVFDHLAGAVFLEGTKTVFWQVTDASGNSAICSFGHHRRQRDSAAHLPGGYHPLSRKQQLPGDQRAVFCMGQLRSIIRCYQPASGFPRGHTHGYVHRYGYPRQHQYLQHGGNTERMDGC
jgi:hypothetical protein